MNRRVTKIGWIVLAALLCLSLVLMLGCTTPAEQEEEEEEPQTLEIGVILPLSGPLAGMGNGVKDGFEAVQDWVNSEGGIIVNGERYIISLLIEDNQSSPDGAVAAANKLVYDDHVQFIIGPIVPPFGIAITSICEQNEVLRVAMVGTGDVAELTPDMGYTFISWSAVPMYQMSYDHLVANYPQVQTVAITNVDGPSERIGADLLEAQAIAHGIDVVCREEFPMDTEDFFPICTKILAAEPDALDTGTGAPNHQALMFKQMRELGFDGLIFNLNAGIIPLLLEMELPEPPTNYYGTDVAFDDPNLPPRMKEAWQFMQDRGIEMKQDHVYAWDSLLFLLQAIEAAQSLDTTTVRDVWETMDSMEALAGNAQIGGLETYGIRHVVDPPHAITKLENGLATIAAWYEIPTP